MGLKKVLFNIKGMTRDLAASKFSPEYAFENRNMRVLATDDNTSGALVNERGNLKVDNSIVGTPIGQAVLGDKLIVFTTGGSITTTTISEYLIGGLDWEHAFNSIKQYSTYDQAREDLNAESLSYVGDYEEFHYYVGHAGYYLAYNSGTSRIVFGPENVTDIPFVSSYNSTYIYYTSSEVDTNIGPTEQDNTDFDRITRTTEDHIYKLTISDNSVNVTDLYSENLNFSTEHPIESITVYENEKLQKIYWTDGYNQPRVINIADTQPAHTDAFDFIRKLKLTEGITIERNAASSGVFAPGTIQYIFTYYNLYGQQSNVFYTSPLYYISYSNRGANASETVGVSFKITITPANYTLDTTYDYIRIYSIHRTTTDAVPQVRKVTDLAVPSSGGISYTDFGTEGETIDPTEILYIGGYPISAGTLEQKDNTLFLGDLNVKKTILSKDAAIKEEARNLSINFKTKTINTAHASGYYTYKSQLSYSSSDITTYKRGEIYRFGLQFQDKYGIWSDPLWIGDAEITMRNTDYSYTEHTAYDTQSLIMPYVNMSSGFVDSLITKGYVKVRPVVVFPSLAERKVVCQGVLCPTVYNAEDRYNGTPTIMSSWFFRPNAPGDADPSTEDHPSYAGSWAEYRHNKPIPGNTEINSEIQCISNPPAPMLGVSNGLYTEKTNTGEWIRENKECFYIDRSVVTLHSPDIEFDPAVRSVDSSDLELRIVGYVPITAHISDIEIETSTPPLNYSKGLESYPEVASGFKKYRVGTTYNAGNTEGWKSTLSGLYWLDELYGSIKDNTLRWNTSFVVYPWHRRGSLNNTRSVKKSEGDSSAPQEEKSSLLSHKRMSTLRYSSQTKWFSSVGVWGVGSPDYNGISGIAIFNSNENSIVKILAPENSGSSDLIYSGNIEKVIYFHDTAKTIDNWETTEGKTALDLDTDAEDTVDKGVVSNAFYPIVASRTQPDYDRYGYSYDTDDTLTNLEEYYRAASLQPFISDYYVRLKDIDVHMYNNEYYTICYRVGRGVQSCSNDPVSMKYKSTPHAVIALNCNSAGKQIILPERISRKTETYSKQLFWDPYMNIKGYISPGMSSGPSTTGYLWVGELYNPNTITRFGGISDEALASNNWVPAGVAEVLQEGRTNEVDWTEGDTYYQRYDCLKTYPFSMEDQNSVVDILSFMCETRVNIDGRYDRNRGQINNLYMTPANFNLLNPAYTQKDNFFSYHAINPNKLVLQEYPNTITWTKTKTSGEEIDTWTNVTLASTLDLDGDLGKVRALRRFKDSLLAFQDTGISQILYNESVQIASTTGVPIEIANSGKVTGKRYISNKIGCTNKWSICSTPNGLYFYDGLSKDIYLFNGEFNNLSDKFGFHSWAVNNLDSVEPWTPSAFNSNITYYDKVNGEVLFITKDDCLTFSEPIGQFTSFYNYGRTPIFANIKDRGIAIHTDEMGRSYYPYLHHEGNYNQFYGTYYPYGTTVVVNPNPTEDKVFNNLEFRADTFDNTGECKHNVTFDTLTTWNEYQKGIAELSNTIDKPSTLKKKFRVWRANIPRNTESETFTRDRMRNPWLYLKLSMEKENSLNTNYKTVLHDLVVDYFE